MLKRPLVLLEVDLSSVPVDAAWLAVVRRLRPDVVAGAVAQEAGAQLATRMRFMPRQGERSSVAGELDYGVNLVVGKDWGELRGQFQRAHSAGARVRLELSAENHLPHVGGPANDTEHPAGAIVDLVELACLCRENPPAILAVKAGADPRQLELVGERMRLLLAALQLRSQGVRVISCPTCARTRVPLADYAHQVAEKLDELDAELEVAVMGCEVNGPGEARLADVGVAFGEGRGLLFRKGQALRSVPAEQAVEALLKEVEELAKEQDR